MVKEVDARGLACPQPVILTRKAMQEADQVVTLVDNEAAVANVTRMATKAGWQAGVTSEGSESRIELAKGEAVPGGEESLQPGPIALGRAEAASGPLVLFVPADTMGRGDAELGTILVRAFFHTLGEVEPCPQVAIFVNSGIKLACEGSPVLDDLHALEAGGLEILVCGTCLSFYELKDELAVGQVSNMYDIAETLLRAGKVVNL